MLMYLIFVIMYNPVEINKTYFSLQYLSWTVKKKINDDQNWLKDQFRDSKRKLSPIKICQVWNKFTNLVYYILASFSLGNE